jgi:hypothetical protein
LAKIIGDKMNNTKKIALFFFITFFIFQKESNAQTQWTGQWGTISVNSYIDTTVSMTGRIDLTADLEIRTGGVLNLNDEIFYATAASSLTINGGTINIQSGGVLRCNTNLALNSGTLTILEGSDLIIPYDGGSGSGIVCNGGTLDLQAEGLIGFGNSGLTTNSFFNSGTFIHGGGGILKGSGATYFKLFSANINNVAPIPGATQNLTIPSGQTMVIPSGSVLEVSSTSTLTNNGTIIAVLGETLIMNGFFIDNSLTLDQSLPEVVIPPAEAAEIPDGAEVAIPVEQDWRIEGELTNLSGASLNIYGTVYTYSIIKNGGATAGTINVNFPGALYLLGGTVENNHANSAINVNSGGSLYNYYGSVDLNIGGADSLEIKAGGKYHNVRGNSPGTFTLNNGCKFLDSNVVDLDKNIDVGYTWTFTETAVINGNGNIITFGDNGRLFVENGVSLLLSDIILKNVSGNKIDFADHSSTLSINNVVWIQDTNFSLTMAKIYVQGDWLITGQDTIFSYETTQASTIANNTAANFSGVTFNYNSGSSNSLIEFSNNSSKIIVENGTLLATENWSPTTGEVITYGDVTLNGVGTLNLQGLNNFIQNGSLTRIGNVVL